MYPYSTDKRPYDPSFTMKVLASRCLATTTFFTLLLGLGMLGAGLLGVLSSGGIGLVPAAVLIGGGGLMVAGAASVYYGTDFFRRRGQPENFTREPEESENTTSANASGAMAMNIVNAGRYILGKI